MDILNTTLSNWNACDPHGVVLSASSLGQICQLFAQKLEDPSLPASARADAAELFSVVGSGLPPLLQLLRVSGSTTNGEVIHFFRFWQASEDLARRLQGANKAHEGEPLAEEIAEFRDGLLRRLECGKVTQGMDGFLTQATLEAELARIMTTSSDTTAWAMLEADLGVGRRHPTQQLQLHLVFEGVLSWLHKVCEDYLRGERAAKICCVNDVTHCGRRGACLRLSAGGWDVETALRVFFAGQVLPGSISLPETSWSSQGAKLRKDETDCPICMHPYAGQGCAAVGAPMELPCCFQVLCHSCYRKIVNDLHVISCPFCRAVCDVRSESLRSGARRRRSPLAKIGQTAERLASGARRFLNDVHLPVLLEMRMSNSDDDEETTSVNSSQGWSFEDGTPLDGQVHGQVLGW